MAQILVAQFDDFATAEAAASELRSLGIAQGDIEISRSTRRDSTIRFPIGGDEDADRGARKGDEGAVAGAAIGGAAGFALGAAAIPDRRARSRRPRGSRWAPIPARSPAR